jgi:quercetin dioxygenase-like cupin family protein
MRRSFAPLTLAVLFTLVLVAPALPAFGQATGVTLVVERRIEAAEPPPGAEISQSVLEFAPGAWTPLHSHGGASYNTVLAGEITLSMGGVDQTFTAGEGWIDQPCIPHRAGNRGTTNAQLVATFVVARDIPPSIILDPQEQHSARTNPMVLATHKLGAFNLSGPMDVIHRAVSMPPGSTVPAQTQPGPSIVSVLQGAVSIDIDGTTRTVTAGRSWTEPTDAGGGYTTNGSAARVVATTFVPRGESASTPAESAAVVSVPGLR